MFLGHDLKHDRPTAIKVLRPEIAAELGTQRFLKEVRITANLSHPHVLALLDSGEVDGLPYYVMPYIDGETLRNRLARDGPLPTPAALEIAREVGSALSYAHTLGILHRDVKPENILLTHGRALLADFGIARAAAQAGNERFTASGVAVGTPAYMSPEQAVGERDLDARSDQYALAAVLYEMLAGEPPFAGPTAQAITSRRLTEEPRPLRARRPDVNPALERAVAKALARDPANRHPSVATFVDALAAGRDTPARARPWRLVGGVVAVLAAVLLLRPLFRSTASPPTHAPRLAVLPLANLGTPDDEPFTAGLTEEITSRLTQIEGLQVVSRTSALRFKDRGASVAEIGTALLADYILEGTVRTDRARTGVGTARVTPQLVRVSDDVRVWQRQFDVPLVPGEIFLAQGRIASEVAAALNVTLGDATRRRLSRIATRDSAAYRLFQLGRFHWERRDAENLQRAAAYFTAAIARDPDFTDAYAGLADATNAYLLLYAPRRDSTKINVARDAARRAIALDSTQAAAHAALGFTLTFFDWDWAAAESSLQRAIQLDPRYGPARYWYTQLLWLRGRLPEALEHARIGVDNDPLSGVAHLAYARTLRLLGREREWVEELHRTIELQPGIYVPYLDLGEHYAAAQDTTNAALAFREYFRVAFPEHPVPDPVLRYLTGVVQQRVSPTPLPRMLARASVVPQPGFFIRAFAQGGARDSAFTRLALAIDARSPDVVTTMPFLERLLGTDPRWQAARARLKV